MSLRALRSIAVLVALVAAVATASGGATAATPRDDALATLRAAKLGLFIHYGPSTLLNAPTTDAWWRGIWDPGYPQLVAAHFRPNTKSVAQWVALATRMHAAYLVFTAMHHDGYRLWASDAPGDAAAGATNWGVDRSHDLLAALAKACRKAHLPLYVYFSLVDLYSHAYRVSDAATHLAAEEQQLTEIFTRYGPLAGVWFDGTWDRPAGFFHLDELSATVHALQPDALVGVNRQPPGAGEDFSVFEQSVPSANASRLPQQSTYPLGRQWFYSTRDRPKTHVQVVALERRNRAAGVSLLLDVPPRADGSFAPGYVQAVLGASP